MNLVYKNEKLLFGVMLAVSMLAWGALLIGNLGHALLYAAAFYLAWYLACPAPANTRATAMVSTPAPSWPAPRPGWPPWSRPATR
ncbi:hypothetical protein ASF04_17745 [Duganella sp. Leaf61]|nr:hypothetical protein ASF04_17745 [Duganella sp. Leaf61]